MGVQVLEHVTIRCAQLKRTRDFYVDLMGLTEGDRPAFPFRGHWLYLGGVAVVHLVEASDSAGAWGREIVIPTPADGTGSFDHVAFRGDDFQAMRKRLAQQAEADKAYWLTIWHEPHPSLTAANRRHLSHARAAYVISRSRGR